MRVGGSRVGKRAYVMKPTHLSRGGENDLSSSALVSKTKKPISHWKGKNKGREKGKGGLGKI